MSKKINLQNILDEIHDSKYRANYKTWYSKQCILDAMKEACKQTLELAVENAEVRITENALIEEGSCYLEYDDGVITAIVDKQSILDTINQIK